MIALGARAATKENIRIGIRRTAFCNPESSSAATNQHPEIVPFAPLMRTKESTIRPT
jgi:hypothetical protein